MSKKDTAETPKKGKGLFNKLIFGIVLLGAGGGTAFGLMASGRTAIVARPFGGILASARILSACSAPTSSSTRPPGPRLIGPSR